MKPESELDALNSATRDAWDSNAAYWDERMGDEGNDFHRILVAPATTRLLDLQPGQLVLEIACGNGLFARRLAKMGAQVVATDFSEQLLKHARERTTEHADRIEYRAVDATGGAALLELGERRFDAAVCNMAIMDIARIEPMLSALAMLLKPGGPFVFSVMHPCFNSPATRLLAEEEDRDGELVTTYAIKAVGYDSLPPARGLAITGQPVPQYYFHRTLSVLFNACFDAGFVLDGIEEPAFESETRSNRALSWANFRTIPPALVARMRLGEGRRTKDERPGT